MNSKEINKCSVPEGETPITWEQLGHGLGMTILVALGALAVWGAIGYWFGWSATTVVVVLIIAFLAALGMSN